MNGKSAAVLPALIIFSIVFSSLPSLADTTDVGAGDLSVPEIPTDDGPDSAPSSSPDEKPLVSDVALTVPDGSGTANGPTDPNVFETPRSDLAGKELPETPPATATPNPDTPEISQSSPLLTATTVEPPSTRDLTGTPEIMISEVQIEGTDATGKIITADEFIELYNPGKDRTSLSGLKLCRKTSGATTSQIKSFSDDDIVPAEGYYLFANSDGKFASGADTGAKSSPLAKDNGIALADNCASPTRIIDSLAWGAGKTFETNTPKLGNPSADQSLVRDTETLNWSFSDCPTPTNSEGTGVGETTLCAKPDPLPPIGTLVINEILPYPETATDEWIEIRNTGTAKMSVAGWKLTDASGKAYPFPKGTVIEAAGYLVISGTTSGITLNNDKETVSFLFPDGREADSFEYTHAEKMTSYARSDNGNLVLTHTPTPGGNNIFDPERNIPPPIGTIVINELFPYPDTGEEEWIEIRNTASEEISLEGWRVKDASSGVGYVFPTGTTLNPNGFLILGGEISKIALNNSGHESVTLLFPDGSVADTYSYEKTEAGTSYARSDTDIFLLTHVPSPGKPNVFDSEPTAFPTPPVGVIRISELFPNPRQKGEGNEWIELENTGTDPVSLVGWTLRSGSGKFTWTEKIAPENREIPPGGFLVLQRSLTKIAMRNSDATVVLLAPDGTTIMDSVIYTYTTEGASFGFFETGRFRWSKTLTPGSANVFGKEPATKKSSIPKKGYVNVLVPFSAIGNGKNIRFVWDFGDGHRSYLPTTSHRFVKSGTYRGSLTLRDGIEEIVKPFTITIGKYPRRDLHITEIFPNPAGKDTGNEWIRLKNDDAKAINLTGWSIATATEKTRLVNHAILSDRSVGPGQDIILTRADSRFTLPNERAVIELRSPDGKTTQTLTYFRDGGVQNNAIFTEYGESLWAWSVPAPEDVIIVPMIENNGAKETSVTPYESGMSTEPNSDRLSFNEFITIGTPYEAPFPDSAPLVLGVSDERLDRDFSSAKPSFVEILFRLLNSAILGT
ncbi:MAG: PKD domain-containing protein [Candidatus Moranbacteria bacterium]|nr:PKD domain-containing protein [Candidatus Moranbacteria bacterium]